MYGSYGSFKRLGLSTTSHREPRMTQREWMSAYGTTNNLSRVSAAERQQRRGPLPTTAAQRNSQPHRSDSQAATVAAMVRAANAARQAEAERARNQVAEGRRVGRENDSKENEADGDDDDVQYSSDDEVDDEEAKPVSGIEKEARADRRLQQLRKRHKADQDKERKRREKTRRTRTLRRTQSDIQPAEEQRDGEGEEEKGQASSGPAMSLPSLGGVNVEDVRDRTRLLLREALIKTDKDATEATKAEELERQRKLKQRHSSNYSTRKRQRQEDEDEEADERQSEEEDQYTLLASDIEQCLYEHHSFSHGTAYRQHSRSLLFSLVNNTQLTPALLALTLSPQQLVTLPTTQLASADIAQVRAKEQQEATRDLVLAVGEGTRSSEYVCGGCGGRETEWWLVKEGRDMRKAEVWGGGGDDGTTIILIRCCKCSREWRKEV